MWQYSSLEPMVVTWKTHHSNNYTGNISVNIQITVHFIYFVFHLYLFLCLKVMNCLQQFMEPLQKAIDIHNHSTTILALASLSLSKLRQIDVIKWQVGFRLKDFTQNIRTTISFRFVAHSIWTNDDEQCFWYMPQPHHHQKNNNNLIK